MSPTFTASPVSRRPDGETRRMPLVLEPSFSTGDLAPIVLATGTVCLGSADECDIQLGVRGVAPRHCLIVAGSSRIVVKALSPMTWLNDGLVRESTLRCGDRLTLGPLQFRVRDAFPSELFADDSRTDVPARRSGHNSGPLWNEAVARCELADAAAQAQKEFQARAAHRFDRPAGSQSLPDPAVTESLVQQREYLTQLAEALSAREQDLTAREHELTAREADLRFRWQELDSGMATIQVAERDAAAQQADLCRRQATHDAACAQLESDRAALDAQRAGLEALRRLLEEQQSSLQTRLSESEQEQVRLHQRAVELAALEERLTSDRLRLADEQETLTRNAAELVQLNDSLQRRQTELDDALTAVPEHRDNALGHQVCELEEQRHTLDALQQELGDQAAFLAREGSRLEMLQLDCDQRQRELEQAAAELELQRSSLALELAALESQRAELLAQRQQMMTDSDAPVGTPAFPEINYDQARESAAAGCEALQSEWDDVARARAVLEAERADLRRQIQEFAAARAAQAAAEAEPVHHADEGFNPIENNDFDDRPADSSNFQQTDWISENAASSVSETESAGNDLERERDSLPEHWESLHAKLTAQLDPASLSHADAEAAHAPASDEQPFDDSAEPEVVDEARAPVPTHQPTASVADDPVQSLRSRLAELFGISHPQPSAASHHHESAHTTEPDVVHAPHDGDEPLHDVVSDDARETETTFEAAIEPAAMAMASPAIDHKAAASASSEDDSITAYMERLLARSRQAVPEPPAIEPMPAAPTAGTPVQTGDTETAPVAAGVEAVATAHLVTSKALSQPDKDQLRANLDSFRELANISARSAVAKHESKKLHTVVQFKLVVLAIAFGLSLALWAANLMSRGGYVPYAIAASIATAVMGGEVVRTLLAFYRWKSVESASLWDDAETEASADLQEFEVVEDDAPIGTPEK